MNPEERKFAKAVVQSATPEQRSALLEWSKGLKEIRASDSSSIVKARRSVAVTVDRKILVPVLKAMKSEAKSFAGTSKRMLWDDRGWAARLGLIGFTVGTLGFSGKAAGLAAFGRAVAVPIWLVLTASGTLLGAIIQEIEAESGEKMPRTTYTVIDADRRDE